MDRKTQDENKPLLEEDIPAILHVCGEERDPNLQDVPARDIPKYLVNDIGLSYGRRLIGGHIMVSVQVARQSFVFRI